MRFRPVFGSRWMRISLTIVLLLLAFPHSNVQAAASPQQSVPRFDPAPCMIGLLPGTVEGKDVICGYVVVPERYAHPDGPTIRLAVEIIKSQSENPAPDPFFIMQGGPGGSTIEDFTTALFTIADIRAGANRDIILFDQRGTLNSQPSLYCQEYDQYTLDTLNVNLSNAENQRLFLEAMQKCRDRLVAQGVNLSAYNSFENAADVDSIRQALGYSQINLYGVSYGTLLALNVMRSYPDGLRSVILDSVVPPQRNFAIESPQSEQRSFSLLFATCAQDPDCNAAYPDLKQEFFSLVDQLNQQPDQINLTDAKTGQVYPAVFTGDALIGTIFQMLYSTELIPLLPRVIADVKDGEYDVIERILSIVVFDNTISIGMYYSVMCSEDADFQPQDVDLSNLQPQLAEASKDTGESFLQTCQLWDVTELGPAADEPVTSSVPTLVLSGQFDPITPPAYGAVVAQDLSNSYSYVFPAGGHGAMLSGTCQNDIILAFLQNPNQAPDASCIENQSAPEYVTPSKLVSLPILPRLLNLQGTSGIEMILYLLGVLFLLSAAGVYPLVWLVRLIMRNSASRRAVVAGEPAGSLDQVVDPTSRPDRKPLIWRLAPWLAVLVAGLLLIFSVILVVIIVEMVTQNDVRFLVGLPATARPLFILPPIVVLLGAEMLVLSFLAWFKRWGSVWGRLYYSLLSLSALLVLGILGIWGMLTALVTG